MEHRKTPSKWAFVPAVWFIVSTMVLCVAAAGWLGWLLVDRATGDEPANAAPTPTVSVTPPVPSDEDEGDPSLAEDPAETPVVPVPSEEPIDRSAPVSVLNNTGTPGLAAGVAARAEAAGWPAPRIGNWRGSIPSNTVYYPDELADQARQLAEDLGIDRLMPRVAPMPPDRLTVILSGPQ